MDDDRLLREIVYYTDRTDITEELTRLGSHFVQLEECLSDVVPVGRKLDFFGAGNVPGNQHDWLQGERRQYFQRGGYPENRVGKKSANRSKTSND